jgi:Fe-S-cluster containining protein
MKQKDELEGFECQQCGICCRWEGDVLLEPEDVPRLAVATGLSEAEFIERYTVLASNRRQLSLSEHSDGSCVFLEENRCAHYDARPEQCRTFPHAWRVVEGCPALDALDKDELKR